VELTIESIFCCALPGKLKTAIRNGTLTVTAFKKNLWANAGFKVKPFGVGCKISKIMFYKVEFCFKIGGNPYMQTSTSFYYCGSKC